MSLSDGPAGQAQHAVVVGCHRDVSSSALGQQVADVAGHGANRGHVARGSPCGWVRRCRARRARRGPPRAVADGDQRGAGERLVRVLLADAHQHRAGVHLAHQPQDDDLFFQCLQQRADGAREVQRAAAGQVRRAADDQPVLARLDEGLDQGGADRGDQAAQVRRGGLEQVGDLVAGLGELGAGERGVEQRAQLGDGRRRRRRTGQLDDAAARPGRCR